jgi:hypothetical protein
MQGWIKLHRQLLQSSVYKYREARELFEHLLLCVHHSPEPYTLQDGTQVMQGEYIRSLRNLQQDLSYYDNQKLIKYNMNWLRKGIDILVRENVITIEKTQHGTKFHIINFGKYQNDNALDTVSDNQPESNINTDTQTFTQTFTHPENVKALDNQGDTEAKPEPLHRPLHRPLHKNNNDINKNGFKQKEIVSIPDDLMKYDRFIEHWELWLQFNKERKKKLPDTTIKFQLSRLKNLAKDGNNPIDVINQSIERNYTGLFPVKQNNNNSQQQKFIRI